MAGGPDQLKSPQPPSSFSESPSVRKATMINPVQLKRAAPESLLPQAHWQRSRSPAYARLKAAVLTLAGRCTAGSIQDAVGGHAALIKLTNTHDRLTQACRAISLDVDGRSLWDTPLGELWTPAGSSPKYVAGIVAEQMMAAYSHPGMPECRGEIVLDCGANVGIFTRQAVSRGAKLVVAVEPSHENAVCLQRNLASEIDEGKVILVRKALGDQEGELWLDTSNRANPGSWTVSSHASPQGQSVVVTTVDKIVEDLRLPRVDRLKIDVEGFELAALVGAQATLAKWQPSFVVAVEHGNEDAAKVISAIRQIDDLGPRYRFHCGFHRCDEKRRLLPQIVYFAPRNRRKHDLMKGS